MGMNGNVARHRGVLVGCGGMAAIWLEALGQYPTLELVGLCDVDRAAAERRKEEFGLGSARVGTDLEGVLEATRPGVVFDLTPPEHHHATAMTAYRHGCHVFAEKPLADSLAHALEMRDAAHVAGRLHGVMQNRRFDPRLDRLRELTRQPGMGALTTLNADFYVAPRFGGFREQMRHPLLLDMAIHHFDAARALCGAEARSVYCHEWNPPGSWFAHGASALAIFEMTNGAIFTYRGSWCASGLPTTWECDWRAVCEAGTAQWVGEHPPRAEIRTGVDGFDTICAPLEAAPAEPGEGPTGHAACIATFMEALESGHAPPTTIDDNIHSLAMVMGAIESARTQRRIMIPELIETEANA